MSALGLGFAAQAVQFADGTVQFETPPRLIDSAIREHRILDNNVKYFFDLSIPADAGEPLQRIDIAQQDDRIFTRVVDFDVERSQAFVGLGQRRDRGDALTISTANFDDDTNTVTLIFDPPVPPGTDLTISLHAERNPRLEGIYLFGVTAYPQGELSRGQFLGYGRFHIYDNGGSIFDR